MALRVHFSDIHLYNFYKRYALEGGVKWDNNPRKFQETAEYFLSRPCTQNFYLELPTGKYNIFVIEGKVFIPKEVIKKLNKVYLGGISEFCHNFRRVKDYYIASINKNSMGYWIVLSSRRLGESGTILYIPIKIFY